MKRMKIPTMLMLGFVIAVGFTTIIPENDYPRASLDRYKTGRSSLSVAIDALGGYQALSSFKDISFSFQAVTKARGQSATYDGEYTELPAAGHIVFESTGRLRYDFKTEFRGGRGLEYRRVLDNTGGWTHRLGENELTELSSFDLGFVRGNPALYPIDALPHSLVLSALGNGASIRGVVTAADEHSRSVTFSTKNGSARTLVIDATTGLPQRVDYVTTDPLYGDVQAAVHFSEYRSVAGIRIPHRLSFTLGGDDLGHWMLSDVQLNGSPSEDVFARPDMELTEHATPFQPQKLADGVYGIRLYSGLGFTYNTMLVEFDHYLVVVEAPLSDFFYNIVAGIGEKVAPGKPIRYLVSTHYHFDHTNGVKAYLANGATVLTVDDNARYLRRMAQADHTLLPNPLKGLEGELSIESIGEGRTIESGARSMRLINVGTNAHVDDMLIAYLPEEKILFVSDLLSTFDGGHFGPPTEALLALDRRLHELGIEAETFVPGHGPAIGIDGYRLALGESL